MLEQDIRKFFKIPPKKMIFTDEDMRDFFEATTCWICNEEFNDIPNENGYKRNEKVRDHCHFTGRYRGAAHNICNLKYRKPNFTPVVFHNLSGYDSHLFIKNLGFSEGDIDCIPNNEERYISFTKKIEIDSYMKKGETKPLHHYIRFIDSFKFMAESLDNLVKYLPKDKFKNLEREYKNEKFNLLARKGVYPYEYKDSFEKLKSQNYHRQKHFILVLIMKISVMRIIYMLKKFGKHPK